MNFKIVSLCSIGKISAICVSVSDDSYSGCLRRRGCPRAAPATGSTMSRTFRMSPACRKKVSFFYQFFVDLGALAADFALGSVLSMSPSHYSYFSIFGPAWEKEKKGGSALCLVYYCILGPDTILLTIVNCTHSPQWKNGGISLYFNVFFGTGTVRVHTDTSICLNKIQTSRTGYSFPHRFGSYCYR